MLSIWIASLGRQSNKESDNTKERENTKAIIAIPWFALGFIGIVGFNSLDFLSVNLVDNINQLDNFALTMAMTALGMETRFNQFKGVGFKPIYLASVLFIYLMTAGYVLSSYLVA